MWRSFSIIYGCMPSFIHGQSNDIQTFRACVRLYYRRMMKLVVPVVCMEMTNLVELQYRHFHQGIICFHPFLFLGCSKIVHVFVITIMPPALRLSIFSIRLLLFQQEYKYK